jgi:hypothetical protein
MAEEVHRAPDRGENVSAPPASFGYAFLNLLPRFYESLRPDQKRDLESRVKDWLLSSFQSDLDKKVERALSTGTFGPLPLVHEFVKFMPELLQLYINGLYYSAIALAGVTAERFCLDLVNLAEIQVDARTLSNEEKRAVAEMRFSDLIDLLEKWNLIQDSTKTKLHEMRRTRNKYMHPQQPPFETAEADAKRLIELACDIAETEFGPGGTGRYLIQDGGLMLRRHRNVPA